MLSSRNMCEQVLVALRRVTRAIDLHSKQLVQTHGLTGPQALLLKELLRGEETSVGELAQRVSLSQATVTDILNRLEKRRLVVRQRSNSDKRRVLVQCTDKAAQLLETSPPLLQERFAARFGALQEWEQTLLLSSLQRIAAMMDATDLDAAPMLASGPVAAPAEAVKQMADSVSASVERQEAPPPEEAAEADAN